MIKAVVFDLSRVLLNAKDKEYKGELNALYRKLSQRPSFRFLSHFELDEELIRFIHTNLAGKLKLVIFTSGIIQEAPEIKDRLLDIFPKVISAEKSGYFKNDIRAYDYLVKILKLKPHEILFVDDNKGNLQAAANCGLGTIRFKGMGKLVSDLKNYLK